MFARNLSAGNPRGRAAGVDGGAAQVSDDIVKIGVLTDMNGPASTPTGQARHAAQMAIDDFGGKVLGKPITVIVGDHQLEPDIGGGIARRWYDVDRVDLIVDVPVSAVGLAVQNIANDKKKLFITHSTGRRISTASSARPTRCSGCSIPGARGGTAQEVVKRGGDSWFFITDDYAFGHSLERDACGVVTKTAARCSARCGRRSRRPTCRRSCCKHRRRRPRSSASPPARPTTPTDQDRRRIRHLQG